MAVNGKAKGATFERTVAKLFADAMGIKLRRTPMSGGWSHDNPDTAGDLVCIEGEFEFCVECKCAEGWKLESLFTGNHKWFDNWWGQLMRESPAGKVPILVFSRARHPILAAIDAGSPHIRSLSVHSIMYVNMPGRAVAIVLLDDLLERLKMNPVGQAV